MFNGSYEVGSFQQGEVLAHGLTRHTHVAAEVIERAAVFIVKTVEQFSPGFISQSFEHCIHCGGKYATEWLHVNGENSANGKGRFGEGEFC
jgi:hypothetical protein